MCSFLLGYCFVLCKMKVESMNKGERVAQFDCQLMFGYQFGKYVPNPLSLKKKKNLKRTDREKNDIEHFCNEQHFFFFFFFIYSSSPANLFARRSNVDFQFRAVLCSFGFFLSSLLHGYVIYIYMYIFSSYCF